jgi:hypothetical protein
MTKSTKNGKAVYNFLDAHRFNIEISSSNNYIHFADYKNKMMFNINQTTANELIKVLKEFVNTGELK